MAGLKDADDFKDGERFKGAGLLKFVTMIGGIAGLVIFFLIAILWKDMQGAMAYSWLFAVTFFLSLSVGGLFWTLLHHASNSGWGTVVRRLMENLGMVIPAMLILGLPLLVPGFRDALWEWFPERADALEAAEADAKKELDAYLAEVAEKAEKATAAVEKKKGEMEAQGELSPGHRRYFEDNIAELEKEAEKVTSKHEEYSKNNKKALETLTDKFFLKKAALLYFKRGYLNEGFWIVRLIFYFVALTGIIYLLRRWSTTQDSDGDPKWFRYMRRFSCGFLPLFAVSWTFLVFDWLMGLDYAWFSTMWGVYLFAGAALNSMGLLILILTLLRRAGYLKDVVTMEHYHLMGKLMHAFVIFWAYIAFSQFFLIWYANITEETKFYLQRNAEFWNAYTITFLVIGHFFIPFVILLMRQFKKMPLVISCVAIWNLLMHVCDIYWIIIPERGPSLTAASGHPQMTIPGAWVFDILAFLTVGCIFVHVLLRVLGSASLFPCRDPRLDESLNVVN